MINTPQYPSLYQLGKSMKHICGTLDCGTCELCLAEQADIAAEQAIKKTRYGQPAISPKVTPAKPYPKYLDTETYDFISTLREIYHSVQSSTYARRLALDCLEKHDIPVTNNHHE